MTEVCALLCALLVDSCGVFVKLVASTDRLLTWIDLYSFVDHFTVVPTFVGIYTNTDWLGQSVAHDVQYHFISVLRVHVRCSCQTNNPCFLFYASSEPG